jgi:hypothetical protein
MESKVFRPMNDNASEASTGSAEVSTHSPGVIADFSGYTPPFDPVPVIKGMLASVPAKYLVGLKEVVLTNSSDLTRKRRRAVTKSRRRKVRIAEARGLYHQAWQGNQAWIEIFVDNSLKGWEKGFWLKIPFVREGRLSEVLFHEVGHHIHFTARPEYQEKEDVADVWKARLERNYGRQRFRWLGLVERVLKFILGPAFGAWRVKLLKTHVSKGTLSRAEFDELTRKR